jgi:hypothetical protein
MHKINFSSQASSLRAKNRLCVEEADKMKDIFIVLVFLLKAVVLVFLRLSFPGRKK